MELAVEALGGLQLAADSFRMSDDCFPKLIRYAIDGLLLKECSESIRDDSEFSKVDQGVLKQAYYGLVTLFVEATRFGADTAAIQTLLEDCKFSSERAALICSAFEENRDRFTARLKRTTFHLPHIVDVEWRLDYCIKSNHLDKINQPIYFIELTTKKGGSKEPGRVMFTCTVEQLQDLVSKLKDAVKCWEKKSEDSVA